MNKTAWAMRLSIWTSSQEPLPPARQRRQPVAVDNGTGQWVSIRQVTARGHRVFFVLSPGVGYPIFVAHSGAYRFDTPRILLSLVDGWRVKDSLVAPPSAGFQSMTISGALGEMVTVPSLRGVFTGGTVTFFGSTFV